MAATGRRAAKKTPRPRRITPAEHARLTEVTGRLLAAYPQAECALVHHSPHELLVATILSAQCTDERVNMVTPALFRRYPTPADLARAGVRDLQQMIRSTGFFRNKARAIKGAMQLIVDEHGGAVPRTMEELLELPGVARKTANVVLGTAYGIADGVVVDTHVYRLAHRLRYSRERDPAKVERDLMAIVPREHWIALAHTLIWHGRQVCIARKPRCGACVVRDLCPFALPVDERGEPLPGARRRARPTHRPGAGRSTRGAPGPS